MAGGSGNASRNFGRLPMSRYRNAHLARPGRNAIAMTTYLGWLDYSPLRRYVRGNGAVLTSPLNQGPSREFKQMKNEAGGLLAWRQAREREAPASRASQPRHRQ